MKYGKLTVVNSTGINWTCLCDCGKTHTASKYNILKGRTKSCGCGEREARGKSSITHGLRHHPLYGIWCAMKNRCYNKKVKSFHNYGGRGITVCNEWRNDFKAYYDWCMNNGWEPGLEIDRRDNNGNYTPENCRIATVFQQQRNTRKNVITEELAKEIRMLCQSGEKQSVVAVRYNVSPQIINQVVIGKTWI